MGKAEQLTHTEKAQQAMSKACVTIVQTELVTYAILSRTRKASTKEFQPVLTSAKIVHAIPYL